MRSSFKTLVAPALLALSLAFDAADGSSLKPPPGAKVAVVMFEDLECPDCARAYPVVWEAAKAHHVPVMLYDFPLPFHTWSFKAAVYARYFDSKSTTLGNDFREYVYSTQPKITPQNLRQYVQSFADQNKVELPSEVDPQGKLKEMVQADYQLGQRIHLQYTPTVFVIGENTPFVEVVDRQKKLGQIIEDMQRKVDSATPEPKVAQK